MIKLGNYSVITQLTVYTTPEFEVLLITPNLKYKFLSILP